MAVRNTAARRRALAELLLEKGSVQITELTKRFSVSRETIRKDLIYLEQEGIGRKGRGGSFLTDDLAERPLSSRQTEHMEQKKRIARAALSLIPEQATILLDSGSTTCELARLLRLEQGLTVVTNSAQIPELLAGTDNTVFSLGGELRSSSMAYTGMWTLNALQMIHGDVAFLGADGLFPGNGPGTSVYAEAEVKKRMLEAAKKSVLLCDSSKLSRDTLVQICGWEQIDCLITDDQAVPEQIRALEEHVKVILA